MKSKEDIVNNWLPRYTGMPLDKFEKHIILVNFSKYVRMFADHPRQRTAVVVMGRAHVSGYSTILVEKHGYTRVTEW